jgi:D-alanyl-D-alanine carboxypeptidase
MKSIAILVAIAFVAIVASPGAAAPNQEPPYARSVRPKLEALVKEMLVPGAVVVVRSEKLGDWTATFGTQKRGGEQRVAVDDHIRIGSNTKTMTGTVVLQLVQEGKLRLDDQVSKYRPDVPNGENITIEHLLSMRSGLYNYTDALELNQSLDATPERAFAPDEMLTFAFTRPPSFEPGAGYEYSNTNFVLLGLIVEKLTGKPLDQVFEERIFEPLGLDDTSLPKRSSNAIPREHPQGYQFGSNVETMDTQVLPPDEQAAANAGALEPIDVTGENPSWAWAAGGAISTADDLARYVKSLVGGGLLNKRSQQQRLDSVRPNDPGNPMSPGYGYAIADLGRLVGHTGELPGFQSVMGYDPQTKLTVIVWTTLAAAPDGRAPATQLAKAILSELSPPPPPDPPDENP